MLYAAIYCQVAFISPKWLYIINPLQVILPQLKLRKSIMTNTNTSLTKNPHCLLPYGVEAYLTAFTHSLLGQGYSALVIQGYTDSISHFGTWLHNNGLVLYEITREALSRFAQHHCDCLGNRKWNRLSKKYINRVRRFVTYLDQENVIHLEQINQDTQTPALLLRFREHLRLRGLSPLTTVQYEQAVANLTPMLGDHPSQYNAHNVKQAIGKFAGEHSLPNTKSHTVALRAYLRFLTIENLCLPHLHYAVPTVPQWSLSSRPRYITAQEVEQTIEACETTTAKGLRDRCIILLLSRLGLRGGDIVNMHLDDIDWALEPCV